ncbi:COX15/CtaA family protein [Robertkochia sediminum]|uniref:COX15/CtaA family protein n=1 Tax=Robertkochia sediminum TaxID=2785326 RepID=UPI0019320E30|nr:COX15/CtaA family protein [Robertkochia sediminum]MBL7472657.1 COX15/CtaA family protein [Robertkochia sediminum]
MKITLRHIAKTTLVLVYLVIVAGAVVRMTGSGMGCPDWPKCFGYYIPPTQESQLLWEPERTFKEGQVIIREERLLVASKDLTTGANFNPENWEAYTKHDYAIFNATHTWVEYINRLVGALAGLATLIMAIWSVGWWKRKRQVTVLSWLTVFGMGFQAWLGATVVYSVLAPVRITLHMVMALVIVAMILRIIQLLKPADNHKVFNPLFHQLLWTALALTLLQVVLGTQVRQFIDEQVKLLGGLAKDQWLSEPEVSFYIHRSFSIIVLAINVYLAYLNRKLGLKFGKMSWVLVLLGIEILSGMAMYYVDFPFGSQSVHLVIASILFGLQFYLVLESVTAKKQVNSL